MATKMGTGIGKGKAGWECGKDAAQAAVDFIGPDGRPGLVIVFASPHYNHKDVLKGIQSVAGDAPLIGCSSAGEFTEDGAQNIPPAGMIAFECVSQRLRVGEAGVEQQLTRVKNVVGAVPLAGCHGYGQLARTRGAFTGFMSASALVCLFPQI